MSAHPAGKQTSQRGGDRPVRPPRAGPAHLTARHRDFVAQHQDLPVLGCGAAASSPSHPNTGTEIRYDSRNSTARDHTMIASTGETTAHPTSNEFRHDTRFISQRLNLITVSVVKNGRAHSDSPGTTSRWAAKRRVSEWSSPSTRRMRVRVSSASWRAGSYCPNSRKVRARWWAERRV
jgi:hypothetical protein